MCIAREVETRLVCPLLRGCGGKGGMISVDVVDGELKVAASNERPPEVRAAA